jgi:hypothetical protein
MLKARQLRGARSCRRSSTACRASRTDPRSSSSSTRWRTSRSSRSSIWPASRSSTPSSPGSVCQLHCPLRAAAHPSPAVEYASAVALEVRAGSPPTVHLSFKNGTAPFTPYGLLGHDNTSDVPLPELLRALQPAAINGTADWCRACGNTADRGCAAYYSTALRPAPAPAHRGISAAGAGAVGAAVTLAVVALALAVLALLGFLTFGKKGVRPAGRIAPRRSQSSYRGEEDEGIDLKQRG